MDESTNNKLVDILLSIQSKLSIIIIIIYSALYAGRTKQSNTGIWQDVIMYLFIKLFL